MRKGRRANRIATCVALAAVAAGAVSAALPASAPAFAWADRCYVAFRNDTSLTWRTEVYSVPGHWIEFTIPNEPQWWGLHHTYPKVDDIPPGKFSPLFDVYGTLISLGCQFTIMWQPLTTPGQGLLTCQVMAWTWGAKTLHCSSEGGAFRIQDKVEKGDEIGGTVVGTAPTAAATRSTRRPLAGVKAASAPLRRGDLPGRGWRTATAGETRKLMSFLRSVKLPRGCASQHSSQRVPHQPSSSASWLFLRNHDGEQLVTGGAVTFARSVQAREAQAASFSAAAMRCLARGISSLKGISATSQRLDLGRVGEGSSAYRIVIRERSARRPDYLDLVSLRNGRGMAVIGFYSENHRMASAIERAAARAIAARIRRG